MGTPIETVVHTDAESTFISMQFPVSYKQFYLLDSTPARDVIPEGGAPGESDAGIMSTVRGGAVFFTGLHLGNVDLTVSLHRHEPEPLLDEYEDVVEASMQVDVAPMEVCPLDSHHKAAVVLPPLPSETGWYRLRYHARNMDQAFDLCSETPIDAFHLQIWPAPQDGPRTLQAVSRRAHRRLSR